MWGRTVAAPSPTDGRRAGTEGYGALGHHVRGLDGLRAVSMAVVLAYHGELAGVDGGFLGISLFFTLSGFLITSMLLRGHRSTGHIDRRRVRQEPGRRRGAPGRRCPLLC